MYVYNYMYGIDRVASACHIDARAVCLHTVKSVMVSQEQKLSKIVV